MRILVVSDSHNMVLNSQIEEISTYGSFDILVHCGDKYKDADKFASRLNINMVYRVPGNCDIAPNNMSSILTETIKGKKIIITHGHLHCVKSGIDNIKDYAKEENADIVLYGHTHCAQNEIIDNILFFNPGSTISAKCGDESFGIVEIKSDNIKSSIILLKN
ncbi:YfcE family phosphodiesterase [Sedimentibacter sp.]|uniref:YfcE family phosphodiesterase n=1 Tax=Sedimentibacter sp. TaxID=1960295 RepID=UPI0028A77483|nr:YfcE family phosphodiesterase [Sedimentibacter sp.]